MGCSRVAPRRKVSEVGFNSRSFALLRGSNGLLLVVPVACQRFRRAVDGLDSYRPIIGSSIGILDIFIFISAVGVA